ncbi:phytoene synthase [Luteitalea sp. TBR-22]|uniref:presqualene diphosphate synthase HpnD n=1 Tax=Luteitalea sp. TBR-22 TaxID=2802971 RepID=UPI001AFA2934|nr:presqualene diphosphate synthase HpnD [Luteitalea sp. TBR-22]BCS35776.1 phytoene synthase [Luteitalea sp. TBR-22]
MGRDTNFAYSFLALSKDRRAAITAVWDFCRAVDDEVDEHEERPLEERRAGLMRWRDEVAACFEGGAPQTPQGRALLPVIARFPVPRLAFEQLIEGCAMDLEPTRFATFCDLRAYCYRVASTVGLVCIEIFGYENPGTRQYAEELGLALQLTNILRDVPGDLARGRLYIPLDELRAHGVTEDDLRAGTLTPAVAALLERQALRAREQFARADAALPPEDARRLVAARIMGAIYRDLLERIAARDFDVFTERVRVPRLHKARLAVATWMRTMVASTSPGTLRIAK